MTKINWANGNLLTLAAGDTATAGELPPGQLYGLFCANATGHDATTTVEVTWSDAEPPRRVPVPGAAAGQGLASVLFVSGDDTDTVSATVVQAEPGATVQAFLCGVRMPIDTSGITSAPLPVTGQPQPFDRFTRYHTVPAAHWYDMTIESDTSQFMVVRFTGTAAQVLVVNSVADPKENVFAVGSARTSYAIDHTEQGRLQLDLQGDGSPTVWTNASPVAAPANATISLRSLAAGARPTSAARSAALSG